MSFHGEARGEGNDSTAAVRLSEEERPVKVSQGLPANWRERHRRVWMGRGRGEVWNSLISKNSAHYSLSLNFLLIL